VVAAHITPEHRNAARRLLVQAGRRQDDTHAQAS